ncbi:MAG: nucleotidyl transferase AbiEii/AbiGii toxin family protein [Candidatus Magasanikbacteria bacterium]|nr:nucleotidyl transferase AbiEii/AbiGii toxin family protein [Candidatus Magasanikbacteria bacterium]
MTATNQLFIALKTKLDSLSAYGPVDAAVKRNILKEELQYYVLNFLYHHSDYSQWIMYGGSALRICHGLNRMSVDLDFEIPQPCDDAFLQTLANRLLDYFKNTYAVESDFLTIKITRRRGLTLKFIVGGVFDTGHPSPQIHVKIDLNHFVSKKLVIERIPINHDQLAFVITTYNMSALMASKMAAIFSRSKRGVDKEIYDEKGRDIYDLLWYMEKRIIPDLDYLKEKVPEIADFRIMFDRLTVKMNTVSEKNLRDDLTPLFVEQSFIQNWLMSWRSNFLRLVRSYDIRTIIKLEKISIGKEFRADNFFFHFIYATDNGRLTTISCSISDYWFSFREGDLTDLIAPVNEEILSLVEHVSQVQMNDRTKQYIALFYKKAEEYLKKTHNVILGDRLTTKTIRMTADKLNQGEQIVLNKSALLSCELEDLLK